MAGLPRFSADLFNYHMRQFAVLAALNQKALLYIVACTLAQVYEGIYSAEDAKKEKTRSNGRVYFGTGANSKN